MRELIRDLDGASPCPRCGRPVHYKGRGRPPVWCSSECRIEASIERKGNRAVGVQPEVVKVVPVRTRLTEYEKERRASIDAELPDQVAIDRVAGRPDLLATVLEREGTSRTGHRRRDAGVWAELLNELAISLGNGQLYNRDLPELFEPLKRVVDRFERRRAEWGRF